MNIRMNKNIFLFLGILGGLCFASSLYAQTPSIEQVKDNRDIRTNMSDTMEEKMREIIEQLGLTVEQQSQLQSYRDEHREKKREFYQQIRAKRDAIKEELQKEDLDMQKINQIHGELKAVKLQKEDHRLQGILEVREILTPEQFRKFNELTDKNRHWKTNGSHGMSPQRMQ